MEAVPVASTTRMAEPSGEMLSGCRVAEGISIRTGTPPRETDTLGDARRGAAAHKSAAAHPEVKARAISPHELLRLTVVGKLDVV